MTTTGFDPIKFATVLLNDAKRTGKLDELTFVDAKLKWGDLTTEVALNEFVRDLCALANSGQDALLIFGYPPAGGAVVDAPYAQSQVPDNAMIVQKVQARIYPPIRFDVVNFAYDGKTLSLLHVPPTRNRPHCAIKWKSDAGATYDNAVFWREGSTTCGPNNNPSRLPSRAQLDAMFFDRPDRSPLVEVREWGGHGLAGDDPGGGFAVRMYVPLVIDNVGAIPTSVREVVVEGTISFDSPVTPLVPQVLVRHFAITHGDGRVKMGFPLHLALGVSKPAVVEILVSPVVWNGGPQPFKGKRRAKLRVSATDIFDRIVVRDLEFESE